MARRKPPHDDLGKGILGTARAHAKVLGLILKKTGVAELREQGPETKTMVATRQTTRDPC